MNRGAMAGGIAQTERNGQRNPPEPGDQQGSGMARTKRQDDASVGADADALGAEADDRGPGVGVG